MLTNQELWENIEFALRNLTPNCQLEFVVPVVDHCNLNCKFCDHFSPLAEEVYLGQHRTIPSKQTSPAGDM